MNAVNAMQVILTFALMVAGFGAVGGAVRVLAGSIVRLPGTVPVLAGYGLTVTSAIIMAAHSLGVPLPQTVWSIIGVSIIILAAAGVKRWRSGTPGNMLTDAFWRVNGALLGVVAVALSPVIALGNRSWALHFHDFPRYVASVQVWLMGEDQFAARHPGPTGAEWIDRASFEKPAVTAALTAVEQFTGMGSHRLLLPFGMLLLWIGCGAIAYTLRRSFRLSGWLIVPIVTATGLGVITTARLFDGQPGGMQAAALASIMLAIVSTVTPTDSRYRLAGCAVMASLVGAVAFASNFTVMLGTTPVFIAALVWLVWRHGPLRHALAFTAGVYVLMGLWMSPLLAKMFTSFGTQDDGLASITWLLSSPFSMVGWQFGDPKDEGLIEIVSLELWIALTVTVICGALIQAKTRGRVTGFTVSCLALCLNFFALFLLLGSQNYGLHKWTVFTAATVVPLLVGAVLAYMSSHSNTRFMTATKVGVWASAGAAVVGAVTLAATVPSAPEYLTDDTLALEENTVLAELSEVNFLMRWRSDANDDMAANGDEFLPLLLPTPVVHTTSRWGDADHSDGLFLFEESDWRLGSPGVTVIRPVNDSYVLATVTDPTRIPRN